MISGHDEQVLAFATGRSRAVITHNRQDFKRLHRRKPQHAGIVVCTEDTDFTGLAQRIDSAMKKSGALACKLISVTRGKTP